MSTTNDRPTRFDFYPFLGDFASFPSAPFLASLIIIHHNPQIPLPLPPTTTNQEQHKTGLIDSGRSNQNIIIRTRFSSFVSSTNPSEYTIVVFWSFSLFPPPSFLVPFPSYLSFVQSYSHSLQKQAATHPPDRPSSPGQKFGQTCVRFPPVHADDDASRGICLLCLPVPRKIPFPRCSAPTPSFQ